MTKKNKIAAWILIVAVAFAMVLSVCILSHNIDHKCIGNDCPFCQQMASARDILETLLSGALACVAVFVPTFAIYQFVSCFAAFLLQGTLVTLKVKLLD